MEGCSGHAVDEYNETQRDEQGVNKVHRDRYSLVLGVWEGDSQVVDKEHTMKRLDEVLNQEVGRKQAREADVVGSVGMLHNTCLVSPHCICGIAISS
jgi:hypothetical protein